MARRRPPAPSAPQSANLTVDQMQRGIAALRKRIEDLEQFDPRQVQKRWAPEVETLQTAIEETLAHVFGHNTVEYHRYDDATSLDNGAVELSAFGRPAYEPFHEYLADGKKRAILLLSQAVRGLEERIADQEAAAPSLPTAPSPLAVDRSKVFIVHGHDGAPKAEVARFIEKLGFEAIILHERPNKGRTLITKFQEEAEGAGFAVVLLTPDDLGRPVTATELNHRARQNVVFELGYFIGKFGPANVAALVKGAPEKPSDFDGVVYISLDSADWHMKLGQELQEAGYAIDWNKVMG